MPTPEHKANGPFALRARNFNHRVWFGTNISGGNGAESASESKQIKINLLQH